MNKLKDILYEKHPQLRLCGDYYLWEEIRYYFGECYISEKDEDLISLIKFAYKKLTFQELVDSEPFYMQRFDLGGPSSGIIRPRFWIKEVIPYLIDESHKWDFGYAIDEDYYYQDILEIFKQVLFKYEEALSEYYFKIHKISESEIVYEIQNVFFVFAHIKRSSDNSELYLKPIHYYDNSDPVPSLYYIEFEELSYNEILYFSFSKFQKEIIKLHKRLRIAYNRFNSCVILDKQKQIDQYFSSSFYYVNILLSELELEQHFKNWKGVLYNYVIYEMQYKNKKGYACFCTTSAATTYEAYNKENALELGLMTDYAYPNNRGEAGYFHYEGILISPELGSIGREIIETGKKNNWKEGMTKVVDKYSFLSGKLKFFTLSIYLKRTDIISKMKEKILKDAKKGKYDSIEKETFILSEYKWTSELFCYQILKELYKNNVVVHQYRPPFLKTAKGQMSYDVFVFGKNIALEYQGEQHFKPIDVFGGKENFKRQKERDKLKKKLSDKYGIHLIYVDYTENITKDLIKKKIKNILDYK